MNSRQSNIVVATLIVIAFCLVVIAFNTSGTAVGQRAEETVAKVQEQEEILRVVGRVTDVFDGIGTASGFLATDGVRLRLVPYDRGSMAAGSGWKPEFIKLVKYDGRTIIGPVTVESF
jgi:hypothetical protein